MSDGRNTWPRWHDENLRTSDLSQVTETLRPSPRTLGKRLQLIHCFDLLPFGANGRPLDCWLDRPISAVVLACTCGWSGETLDLSQDELDRFYGEPEDFEALYARWEAVHADAIVPAIADLQETLMPGDAATRPVTSTSDAADVSIQGFVEVEVALSDEFDDAVERFFEVHRRVRVADLIAGDRRLERVRVH